MPEMTGGRFLAETMHDHGITHVFFKPLIATKALMEMHALGITRVQPHGEKSAAYMADAYARVSGRVGVCMAQSVGAANLAAGLQDPFLANSPVMAITGRETQANQGRHAYQEIDHAGVFDAVTKYSAVVPDLESFPVYLRQAFREATSTTPGPVHIDLDGFFGQGVIDATLDIEIADEPMFSRVPAFRPVADDDSIRTVLGALNSAQRPVIVAGRGAVHSGAGEEIVALAEALDIPVALTLDGKMLMPAHHRLAAGTVGTYSRSCANQTVSESDLVFYIGCHAGGHDTAGFTVPPPGTSTVQLDIDARELGRNYPLVAGMNGDVRSSLRRLLALIAQQTQRPEWTGRVAGLVAQWHDATDAVRQSDGTPIRPERLCSLLAEHLPSDAVVVSDTGHAGVWTGTMLDLSATQTYVACAGSLGWGVPASLGAKCAAGDRPVVCFTGDGGAWYHIAELETAARCGLPTITVVNNNHSLNQEKIPVEVLAGGQDAATDELWLFEDTDFAAVGESMGALGLTVNKAGEFASALERAINSGRPTVIDVKTDVDAIAPLAYRPDPT